MPTTRRQFVGLAASFALSSRWTVGQQYAPVGSLVTSQLQVNGVACVRDGRTFASLPRWVDMATFSVGARQPDGTLTPFPGNHWNAWHKGASPSEAFVCVNAIHIDPLQPDLLWVVDAAAPAFGSIVPGGPKLVAIRLSTGQVSRVFRFDSQAVPPKGYLNDVRFAHGHAFLSESGTGAILVLDCQTGSTRRLLADHPSTKAVPGRDPSVDGRKLTTPSGAPPTIHVDGIELSLDHQWLLYAVPFGGWLWRVPVAKLLDSSLSPFALVASVEQLGPLMPIGGMTAAPDGGLLLSDVEHHAIVHRAPGGSLTTLASTSRLQWPDASALDTSGHLLVAASQVNHMPSFNGGLNSIARPFQVVSVQLPPTLRGGPQA